MINGNLTKYLDLHSIQYETNVSLKKRTWIHRGGIAELFITPVNAEELEIVVSFLYSQSIRFQLIGHTSNLYILNSCNIPWYQLPNVEIIHLKMVCFTVKQVLELLASQNK